jgi:hypothetical protein
MDTQGLCEFYRVSHGRKLTGGSRRRCGLGEFFKNYNWRFTWLYADIFSWLEGEGRGARI